MKGILLTAKKLWVPGRKWLGVPFRPENHLSEAGVNDMRRRCTPFTPNFVGLAATSVALVLGVLTAATAKDRFDWVEFHADDDPYVTKELSGGLSIGVAATLSIQRSKNLNLDNADDTDEDEVETELDLGVLYDRGGTVRSYMEFNLSTEKLSNDISNPRDVILDVNEAYITFRSQDLNQALTFGRWSVSDDREWLFDEELDGVNFFRRGEKFAFELMYAREQILKKDLLDDHDDNEPDHFYARAYANLPGKTIGSVYGLYQMGRARKDSDLLWLGASLAGNTKNDINYWAEFAHVRGTERNRKVRGFGLDVGLTKTFRQFKSNPRLTAGIAFGSGDDGSGTDNAFRQTDVQGNSDRFGGKTSLEYYGEVFDPELSNLAVLTVGAGFDWLQNSSVDFMYHYNFQHKKSNRLRDSALDQRPTGSSRNLGHEIDVIVAIREFEKFDIDFFGGVFLPGDAFAGTKDVAGIFGVEISIEF